MLNKFEVLLLTPIQVQEFKENFEENNISIQEALFQSWLQLKAATTPTEQKALTQVLDNHSAKNVQKRKTVRKDKKPDGPSRYDPSSPEWVEILEEKENKRMKECCQWSRSEEAEVQQSCKDCSKEEA